MRGADLFIHESPLSAAEAYCWGYRSDARARAGVCLQGLISEARALKAKYNLANKRDVAVFYGAEGFGSSHCDNAALDLLAGGPGFSIGRVGGQSAEGLPAAVTPLGPVYLDLSSSIDVAAEKARLEKELARLDKLVAVGENKLKNPKFVESAPEAVVAGSAEAIGGNPGKTRRDEAYSEEPLNGPMKKPRATRLGAKVQR
jgi:valyl-tRNA synthetase